MIEVVYGGRYAAGLWIYRPGNQHWDGKSYREQVEEPMLASYKEYAGDSKKLQALFQEGLNELGVRAPL